MLYTVGVSVSSSEDSDKLSTGTVVAISIVVTFILTLLVTALVSIIVTCLYYQCRYELKAKVEVDNDNLRRNLIMMQRNPSYYLASPKERVEMADYEYISLKQETT